MSYLSSKSEQDHFPYPPVIYYRRVGQIKIPENLSRSPHIHDNFHIFDKSSKPTIIDQFLIERAGKGDVQVSRPTPI